MMIRSQISFPISQLDNKLWSTICSGFFRISTKTQTGWSFEVDCICFNRLRLALNWKYNNMSIQCGMFPTISWMHICNLYAPIDFPPISTPTGRCVWQKGINLMKNEMTIYNIPHSTQYRMKAEGAWHSQLWHFDKWFLVWPPLCMSLSDWFHSQTVSTMCKLFYLKVLANNTVQQPK